MKISIVFLFFSILLNSKLFAYDYKKCFGMVNKFGFFKKYDFNYAGPWWITCRTSGKESSILVTTKVGMEKSTISLDPGISTGDMSGSTQFSSSWGECSIMGKNDRLLKREHYIAENFEAIKQSVAFGRGEHLETLAWLSHCNPQVSPAFMETLQKNYDLISRDNTEQHPLSQTMDQLITQDPLLRNHCLIF